MLPGTPSETVLLVAPTPRRGGRSARRASRGTVVLAFMAAVATVCTKMLALDQQPPRQHGGWAGTERDGVRGALLQAQALRRSALAGRARARQELIFEPLRKIYQGALGEQNGTRMVLQSPLIVDTSYAHYRTPHLPPLTPHTVLAASRSFGAAVERDGEYALVDAGLEIRRVAEQMLLPQFQPRWLQRIHVRDGTALRTVEPVNKSSEGGVVQEGRRSELGGSDAKTHNPIKSPPLNPIKFLQPVQAVEGDPEIRQFMHNFRHGVEDANNSAYRDIVQGDRIVTEPDDIVKMENEVRQLHRERVRQWEKADEAREEHKNTTATLPGVFRWFEDTAEGVIDNSTNLTLGTWVWCRNESSFADLEWHDGQIKGAPVMKPHQKFVSIEVRLALPCKHARRMWRPSLNEWRALPICTSAISMPASPPRRWCIPVLMLASFQKCVSVSGPGFLDEEDEDKEEQKAKKKQKIEEDEIAELRKRNWDEPFMTYEPHPSAVGWDKAHWKALDWVSWVITGAVLLLIRVGPSNVLGACAAHCGVSHASMSTTPWSLLRSCCGALCVLPMSPL